MQSFHFPLNLFFFSMVGFEYWTQSYCNQEQLQDADLCQKSKVKIISHKNMFPYIANNSELLRLLAFCLDLALLKPCTLRPSVGLVILLQQFYSAAFRFQSSKLFKFWKGVISHNLGGNHNIYQVLKYCLVLERKIELWLRIWFILFFPSIK